MSIFNSIFNAAKSILSRVPAAQDRPQETDVPEAHVAIPEVTQRPDVDIIIDKQIRNKYKQGWINKIRNTSITEVVIHGTAGGNSATNLLRWMYNGERGSEYMKGIALFHYLIGREGEIFEVIDPEYYVYHSTSGSHDKQTIGVEMINPDKMNAEPYTDAQYKALFSLIFDHLMPLYPTINRITSHRYNIVIYNGGRITPKQCPGTGFSWEKLDAELTKRKLTFQRDGQLRYQIKKN